MSKGEAYELNLEEERKNSFAVLRNERELSVVALSSQKEDFKPQVADYAHQARVKDFSNNMHHMRQCAHPPFESVIVPRS